MEKDNALQALAALAHDTRLDVFRLLVKVGPDGLAAGEIGEKLGVRQNTMSTNLAILDRAGLVISWRNGRSVRYRANLDGMRGLLGFLMEDCCGGTPDRCAPLLELVTCET